MLAESVVYELCRSGGLDENIAFVKGALKERRDTLVEALRDHVPEADFVEPGGGYFLWLTLPDDVDTTELHAAALEEKAAFIAGPDFMLEGGRSSLRLSFASVPPDQIGEGVAGSRAPWSGCAQQASHRCHAATLSPQQQVPLGGEAAVIGCSALVQPGACQVWPCVHRRREQTARIFYPAVTSRLARGPNLAWPLGERH